MAGFSQTLQGAQATAQPITEGIGTDMNLQGVAAGLGLAATFIGSSYAESQMDKSFTDVVQQYRDATKRLEPAQNKLNILADTYQKTQDPLLLRQMTELNDQIRRVKLGEDNGKFSGLAAKARVEAAYKTAINKFPHYASELRAHKDAATGTGALRSAIEGSELMRKQAAISTEKLARDMFDASYNINSAQERVRFMALRRRRYDRDQRLKDVEAGYEAILTPMEMMNKIMEERGKPDEIKRERYKESLDILSKELGIEKSQLDLNNYAYKKLLELKIKEQNYKTGQYGAVKAERDYNTYWDDKNRKNRNSDISYQQSSIAYQYAKDTYGNRITSSNNSAISSGETVISQRRGNRVGNFTEKAQKENAYLKGNSMRSGIARTEQTVAHNNVMNPMTEKTAKLTLAQKQRQADDQQFVRTYGVDKTISIRDEMYEAAKSLMKINDPHMTPEVKASQLKMLAQRQLAELERFYDGRPIPQSQINSITQYVDKLAGFVKATDPQALAANARANQELEDSLGKELYRKTIGDTGFKQLAMKLITLRGTLAGTTNPETRAKLEKKISKLDDLYNVMSQPVRTIMDKVHADKIHPQNDGSVAPDVAFTYALSISDFDAAKATPEEVEIGTDALEKALANDKVAADVLDTPGAISLATTNSRGKAMYEKSFETLLQDAAGAIGSTGTLKVTNTGFILNTGKKKLFVSFLSLDKTKAGDKAGLAAATNSVTLAQYGVKRSGDLFEALKNIRNVVNDPQGRKLIKGALQKDWSPADSAGLPSKDNVSKPLFEKPTPGITGKIWDTGYSKEQGATVSKNWDSVKDDVLPIVEKTVGDDPLITSEFIVRLLGAESSFREDIMDGTTKSSAGALGIGQFMESTIKKLGGTKEDALDYKRAIPYVYKYLKLLEKDFPGDLYKIAAAYNAGPGAVRKYNGVPPYKETKAYVSRIVGDTFKVGRKDDVIEALSKQKKRRKAKKRKNKTSPKHKSKAYKSLEALIKERREAKKRK